MQRLTIVCSFLHKFLYFPEMVSAHKPAIELHLDLSSKSLQEVPVRVLHISCTRIDATEIARYERIFGVCSIYVF